MSNSSVSNYGGSYKKLVEQVIPFVYNLPCSALAAVLSSYNLLWRILMNSSSISIQQVREKLMRPRAKRVLMHIGFWILWLSRTFYDIISLYGVGIGECLFMMVYASTQIPMMYFHLYVLVPKLLNRRYYR